jgi:histidine triad (HIT) family protein
VASLFTKIATGEIPGTLVHQDDLCFTIRDIHPEAPLHLLIIPRKEITSIAAASPDDKAVLGHLLLVAGELARVHGVADDGYRLVINTGKHGSQTVPHLHVHLLAGRQLGWPPG